MAPRSEASVLVYDVGGSHVSAAVCGADTYRLGAVVRAPHAEPPSSEAFVQVLHSLGVEACAQRGEVEGAELAFPGPFDFAAGVSLMRHKLPCLFGIDLRGQLAERFGWRPGQVRFVLDSEAYLLGEIGSGAARGVDRVAAITLGTGIGSAVAVKGRVLTEGPGIPPRGEIWNLPYEGGIVEDFVSAEAIRRSYQMRTGVAREVVEVAAAAGARDEAARQVFAEFGRHLGRAIRAAFSVFDPDVIVLGGGISRSAHLLVPSAQRELDGMRAELRVSELRDVAPLVGAGVAWFNCSNDSSLPCEAAAVQSDVE